MWRLLSLVATFAIACSGAESGESGTSEPFCEENTFASCEAMSQSIEQLKKVNEALGISRNIVDMTTKRGLVHICAGNYCDKKTLYPQADVKAMLYEGEFKECKVDPVVADTGRIYWGVRCPVTPDNADTRRQVEEKIRATVKLYQ